MLQIQIRNSLDPATNNLVSYSCSFSRNGENLTVFVEKSHNLAQKIIINLPEPTLIEDFSLNLVGIAYRYRTYLGTVFKGSVSPYPIALWLNNC